MQFTVMFEHGPTSVGAYVPDLPGCVAVGATREEAHALIPEAMIAHLAGMHEDGCRCPCQRVRVRSLPCRMRPHNTGGPIAHG